jgi:hypothetical protein
MSTFPSTLTKILENNKQIISWNKKNQIVIHDIAMLKKKVLTKYFNNTNTILFYKQLNLHGFRKHKHEENSITFKHKLLQIDNDKSLEYMLRNIQPKNKSLKTKNGDINMECNSNDIVQDTASNENEHLVPDTNNNNYEPVYDPVNPTVFDSFGNVPDLYPNSDVREWIVYVIDIDRFIKNTQFLTWGLNDAYQDTHDFLSCVKPGDRLWFISMNKPTILIGVAIYSTHTPFTEWPLIEVDMSHDTKINGCCCQGCWQHHGKHNEMWNVKITYTQLVITTTYENIKFLQSNKPYYNIKYPYKQIIRHATEERLFNLEVCYSYIKFRAL